MDGHFLEAETPARASRTNELLGLPADARVLIVNADDFGMYHAVNAAVLAAIEAGIATSCSLMVPCPWARHAMHLLRERPEIPFGVHLTLFCDTTNYGWGPSAPKEQVPSLLNPSGEFFTPDEVPDLLAQARADEVELEFRAQVEAVIKAGLRPTHLDWHCLADGGREDIFDLTVGLARDYGLAARAWLGPARQKLRDRGLPVVEHDFLDSFALDLDGKSARYEALLRHLPIGLSEWAVHPGLGEEEARAIDPGWRVRRSDHDFLTSSRAREVLRQEGIVVTDYRAIQQAWSRPSS